MQKDIAAQCGITRVIQDHAVPLHLKLVSPDCSSFQPKCVIHERFMQTIHLSLQRPKATVPTTPPVLKLRSLSRVSFSPPFCGFRFSERGSVPLTYRISYLWPSVPNENPNISTTPRQFCSDFSIDDGIWNNGSKWCGSDRAEAKLTERSRMPSFISYRTSKKHELPIQTFKFFVFPYHFMFP
ncbi:hypothetical protein AVEN_99796-1 [Araneus ventricosus]|uniref:Uncharacterized protein n=1 Tax=Araneus ventricosus TaxID=182803 RepID=A0A4Y2KUT9_ARAVE|nr:hypothetical protein AVEN_99796-1 [Araneus ventricosus]